jgi:hypothetical protein
LVSFKVFFLKENQPGAGKLKEADKHSAPKGTFKESKKPDKYSGLIAKLNLVIDSEPSTFEVWEDAMIEEY